ARAPGGGAAARGRPGDRTAAELRGSVQPGGGAPAGASARDRQPALRPRPATAAQAARCNAARGATMSESLELVNGSVEALLGQVADEFTDRLNRGERPEVEDYVRRYPELAAILPQVLPALQVMGPCAPPVESGPGPAAGEVPVSGCLGDFRLI